MTDENDLLKGLHRIMDFVEPSVDKVAKTLSHVHVPGKSYPQQDDNVIDAEIISESAPRIIFGGSPAPSPGKQLWHAYSSVDGVTLCGRRIHHDVWWRPNATSRESILICFGCLSRLAQLPPTQALLPEGDK